MKTTLTLIALAAMASLAVLGCDDSQSAVHHGNSHTYSKDIVDTAVSAGSFNTLVTAVKEAGLVETLKGEGPYTVFAPTDEAFAKLPPGTLEKLLADKHQLRAVLLYHVVPGKVTSDQVVKLSQATTAEGSPVAIHADSSCGTVQVGQAKVVQADVMASNGVIHVIDTVLLPPEG